MKPSSIHHLIERMSPRSFIRPLKINYYRMKPFVFLLATMFIVMVSMAQSPDDQAAAYTKVINQRAAKIVTPLGISDSAKAYNVQTIIAQQYRDLGQVHDGRNAKIKTLKEQAGEGKKPDESTVKEIEAAADKQLKQLHDTYISKLSALLTTQQVDMVKDGMTYSVMPITYKGYQEMIPALTADQKEKILQYLTEAREQAMDAESSEKKHAWFGKYKGRINNYLSAQGYDLKKAGEDWAKRREDAKNKN